MTVGLVAPNNLWFCPYIDIYIKHLDAVGCKYEIIYWDRSLEDKGNTLAYSCAPTGNKINSFLYYFRFSQFAIRKIKERKYDRLIVFTPQLAIFLYRFLRKFYKKRFILDYRDLSIEQNPIFKQIFKNLLPISYRCVISSPGFKNYLPSHEYVISHNFIKTLVDEAISVHREKYSDKPIKILTIGGIRDLESNTAVLKVCGNDSSYTLSFVGRGHAQKPLQAITQENGFTNVNFVESYKRDEEPAYYFSASFINIFYPKVPSHITAISNRFYNSLIFRRPMIVTKGGIQAEYVEKFHVGIAVDNAEEIPIKIKEWESSVNYEEYEKNCIQLLGQFAEEYEKFEELVIKFIKP